MSELRRNPITGRTVIIAGERLSATRLWRPTNASRQSNGPCPFCEGNELMAGRELLAWRDSGQAYNGPGWQVRVVPNRVPALRVESHYAEPTSEFFQTLGGLGAHEVIIESPIHDADWATMRAVDIQRVLWAWRERIRDLRRDIRLKSFLVVKNVGVEAGATLGHPHSQLLALPFVPLHLEDELLAARDRKAQEGCCAFCTLVKDEIRVDTRVIAGDEAAITIAAFAARVPFETWVLPRRHRAAFDEEDDECLSAIAERLRDAVARLDVALKSPPYSVLLHTAPVGAAVDAYHWHIEIVPRLMPPSGLAWGDGIYINPVSPEDAARVMRSV
jgi:UDPglucose--hexose-1-phosphate uridylyltransferase